MSFPITARFTQRSLEIKIVIHVGEYRFSISFRVSSFVRYVLALYFHHFGWSSVDHHIMSVQILDLFKFFSSHLDGIDAIDLRVSWYPLIIHPAFDSDLCVSYPFAVFFCFPKYLKIGFNGEGHFNTVSWRSCDRRQYAILIWFSVDIS